MKTPTLLDLFCGAGGAAVGYARAGFNVVGVDNIAHPDYPFPMFVADAMDVLADHATLAGFDVVHASPPCPRYSTATMPEARANAPDLLGPVYDALDAGPVAVWVIEDVVGAPMRAPLMLCGASFGLGAICADGVRRPLRRHRLFDSSAPIMGPGCMCDSREPIGVYGQGGRALRPDIPGRSRKRGFMGTPDEKRAALGTPWIRKRQQVANAIPPAYTQFIGGQLIDYLEAS